MILTELMYHHVDVLKASVLCSFSWKVEELTLALP